MARKPKRRVGISIDMTPMVDIGFLLLIFYMATTQFKPPEKQQVSLPSSQSEYKVPQSDVINITINEENQIFLEYISNFAAERDTVIDGQTIMAGDTTIVRNYVDVEPRTLAEKLLIVQDRFRRKGVNPFIIVKADKISKYGTVKKVMDVLQDININRFSLMTEIERGVEIVVPESGA